MKQKALTLFLVLFTFQLSPLTSLHLRAQSVASPCPEVLINEKYDHVALLQYRLRGWDTTVTCKEPTIILNSEPYIPVQFFNGYYKVEQIPYNPPDTSFHYGSQLPNNADDKFCTNAVTIPYPFYFFGIRKNSFAAGGNGIITFNAASANQSCGYGTYAPIPWPDNGTGSTPTLTTHRDAIYGVFQDTDPSCSNVNGVRGIWYGIKDAYPCRKIICSYNKLPMYSCSNATNASSERWNSYQIVCYEGSNIIEVHVKSRRYSTYASWCQYGLIGIQNATGAPQVRSTDPDDPTFYVQSGSPAAFFPTGYNPIPNNTDLDSIAFRFTPKGSTLKTCKWYRIFDDGRDSVVLGLDQNDTNGYMIPMNDDTTTAHPTLTQAVVSPRCISRYVMELRFKNANQDEYVLADTITIGIDTANEFHLAADGHQLDVPEYNKTFDVCLGHTTQITPVFPSSQATDSVVWRVSRMLGGVERQLPTSMYTSNHTMLSLRPDPQFDTLPRNKIDSIYVQAAAYFVSGCQNWQTILIRVFPNFDTIMEDGICNGETYTWHPCDSITKTYTSNTNPDNVFVTLHSRPGCDSIVHLKLTVFDVSLTYDDVTDCQTYTWRNGQSYSETNSATSPIDTVILHNRYGCDSVVQLRFTLAPVTARIKSSLDHFDFDHLDVTLTDISSGNDSRRWKFPTAADQTGATAYYSVPVTLNEANIWLLAYSPYGCVDSTDITIPFNKESFWIPNAFTPDDPSGNNIFSSVSSQTIYQEMFIYNRLGELVFQCEGADCGWDGKHTNGSPCPQGAYVYVIRYSNSFEPNIIKVRRGTVTLIR